MSKVNIFHEERWLRGAGQMSGGGHRAFTRVMSSQALSVRHDTLDKPRALGFCPESTGAARQSRLP